MNVTAGLGFPLIDPANPLSTPDLIGKFKDCACYTPKSLSSSRIDGARGKDSPS